MMNSKIKQFIAFGVCSVFALAICLVVLVVTVINLDNEQPSSQVKEIESLTQLENSKESLVKYINNLISNTDNRFVKTNSYTGVSVTELTVLEKTETKEKDEALLNFVKDKMLPTIDSYYADDFKGTFHEVNSKKLSLFLNEVFLTDASFSIGQIDENGESVFDDEGNLVDNEFYYLTFNINGETVTDNKELSEMFSLENDNRAKKQFIKASKENLKINTFDSKPKNIMINAKVNRVTDEIEYINVIRNYDITIDVDFINESKVFGSKELGFVYSVTDTYDYYYAGVSFVEDEVTIGVNEEYMLNVNAVIDDDSEYTVEFSSSDESIASVDEMGYVKGLKNCDIPATITVKLNYLDKTFTDVCVVNVSVE